MVVRVCDAPTLPTEHTLTQPSPNTPSPFRTESGTRAWVRVVAMPRVRSPGPQLETRREAITLSGSDSDNDSDSSDESAPAEAGDYVVKRILNRITSEDGNFLYKVRWKGYGSEDDSFEPEKVLPYPSLAYTFALGLSMPVDADRICTRARSCSLSSSATSPRNGPAARRTTASTARTRPPSSQISTRTRQRVIPQAAPRPARPTRTSPMRLRSDFASWNTSANSTSATLNHACSHAQTVPRSCLHLLQA